MLFSDFQTVSYATSDDSCCTVTLGSVLNFNKSFPQSVRECEKNYCHVRTSECYSVLLIYSTVSRLLSIKQPEYICFFVFC